ncbi:hypothetical protein Taro_056585 [Colocasia esculenta]|uniref:Uncharacterized protein n=1 Tax=Colocasia esculenta TaxID=4460 RepID=A0A843XX40_COLES|nr:hypothetical protein [Colocasia esculenta]
MASSVALSSSGTILRSPFRFPGRRLPCARVPRRCRVAATAVGGTSMQSYAAAEGVGEVRISVEGVRNGAAAGPGTAGRVEAAEERDEEGVGLSVLYDDGFGKASVKDYLDWSREMIRVDGGGPRWFCPLECCAPFKGSPLLLFLPGTDGTGLGLILHHKSLGK